MSYRILLLSAYDAMSHKMWRDRLEQMFPEHSWTQLSLPPRNFNWRIRGNSLQWALSERELLARDYDLLIATSMVDLASLRGFVPQLTRLPTLLYFHENQFVYPAGVEQRRSNIEPQLVPLYAAYCADTIAFNSDYNRRTFLEGAEALLDSLPDRFDPVLLTRLGASEVLPVPLQDSQPSAPSPTAKPLLDVVWNHRWEYDKGPQPLLALIEAIAAQRLPIRLHIVGQQFRNSPPEFEKMGSLLRQHAEALNIEASHFGFVERREDYIELLRSCDVVLSTAAHDFQGLAIQEACALGCTPLAPNALVYPEYIGRECLYDWQGSEGELGGCADLLARLKQWQALRQDNIALPKLSLQQFSQHALKPRYAELFARMLASSQDYSARERSGKTIF